MLADGQFNHDGIPGAGSPEARPRAGLSQGRITPGEGGGDYQGSDGTYHGYLWERGRFVTIDVPGADHDLRHRDQQPRPAPRRLPRRPRPLARLVLERGRYTTFDVPGAQITFPLGLNDRGQIVGFGFDPADLTTIRGFLLAKGAKGPLTPINRPGATTTAPFGINNRGQIVGAAETPAATSSPQPTGMPPMGRMS